MRAKIKFFQQVTTNERIVKANSIFTISHGEKEREKKESIPSPHRQERIEPYFD